MKWISRCRVSAAALLAVFSLPALASEITYYFSGTFSAGSPTSIPIPAGTPFTGTFTWDPTTPHTAAADSQHRNYGLNFGGGSVIWFYTNSPPATVTGTGEGTNPLSVGVVSSVLIWSKPAGGILADANTFTDANIPNLAQWTFAGLDINAVQMDSVKRFITAGSR